MNGIWMITKTTVLVICIYLQGKPIVFCYVHKICHTIGLLRITINNLCSDEQFLPLKKVAAPHLNKQESPSSSDAFIVPSLKLACCQHIFVIFSPWIRKWPIICTNLNLHNQVYMKLALWFLRRIQKCDRLWDRQMKDNRWS